MPGQENSSEPNDAFVLYKVPRLIIAVLFQCDGARPVCNVCKKRGVEKCVYIDKREASEETIEIMDLLKLSTESAAIDILRLLRQTGDPAVVLALLRRDSEERLSSIVDGYTSDRLMIDRSSLETELMMKNAVSYPVLQPLSQSTLEESDLLRSVNLIQSEPKEHRFVPLVKPLDLSRRSKPDQGLIITTRISSQSRDTMKANRSASVLDNDIDPDSALQRFRDTTSSKRTPPEKTKYCDDRLSELDISYWTDIRIPNHLAAKIISLYLETDHPLLGTFDPEQFVPDLVNHQETSCSKFLVNTLLYWGSVRASQ